jgi:hypothetical protein
VTSAFVVGRPPGHHAGSNGFVKSNVKLHCSQAICPPQMCSVQPLLVAPGYDVIWILLAQHSGCCSCKSCDSPCIYERNFYIQAYARYNYSYCDEGKHFTRGHSATNRPLRIAIVDIDVHHGMRSQSTTGLSKIQVGNGTEDIVRNLRWVGPLAFEFIHPHIFNVLGRDKFFYLYRRHGLQYHKRSTSHG